MSRGTIIAIIASISIIGIATIFLVPAAFSYYEQQNARPTPALTQMNISLEPRQTQDIHHPAWRGQVMEVRIEPNFDEPIPDYELLITMVEPGGYTIFNKFIKEPFVQKFIPGHEGWYAIIITNVGNTTIASGARIESRTFDASVDKNVPFTTPCIIPPSFKNQVNAPYPWC